MRKPWLRCAPGMVPRLCVGLSDSGSLAVGPAANPTLVSDENGPANIRHVVRETRAQGWCKLRARFAQARFVFVGDHEGLPGQGAQPEGPGVLLKDPGVLLKGPRDPF